MFKLYKASKGGKLSQNTRDSHAADKASRRTVKQRNPVLTNILEEGNSPEEPRSFEQDELYLEECLKALDGNAHEVQEEEIDLEEYDFDDYNSIASTASLLNINGELALNGNNFASSNYAQLQNNRLRESQPRAQSKQSIVNGEDASRAQHLKISKVQTSILKVRDWSKTNGNLDRDDWKDIFLESAYEGDLKRLQDAYSKLGGTSELVVRITDAFGNTALHKAAEAGSLSTLQWLVSRLPNDCLGHVTNGENLSLLAVAVKYGSVQCVNWLLEETSAADEISNLASRSALIHEAIQHEQDGSLRCLLAYIRDKHLELDVTDSSGVTLAHVAAREGQISCLQALVDHNIDVTSEDKDGRSPADYAYAAGQTSCGRYLVMEESCWLLSVRIAKLHRELKECKDENKDLRQKLEVLENHTRTGLPNRPEVVGGDQSDTSSTEDSKSLDDRFGSKRPDSPHSDRSRISGSPDGESPKRTANERSRYQYHTIGSDHRPLPSKSRRHFEVIEPQRRRLEARESMDSAGSNASSMMSDSSSDNSAMQLIMAKQIAANTRRLVLSKHAQMVEESPLIRIKLLPDTSLSMSADKPHVKAWSNVPVVQPGSSISPSSSRSQSPPRTNSGSSRDEFSKLKRSNATVSSYTRNAARNDRTETPSRPKPIANRRKAPASSSDSTISSDSDVELGKQRSNAPRIRRANFVTNRMKQHSGNITGPRQSTDESEKRKISKTGPWKESLKEQTDQNEQIGVNKPRVPPKPPVRTVSRDSVSARARSRDDVAKSTCTPHTAVLRDREPHMIRLTGSECDRTVLRDNMSVHGHVPRNPVRDGLGSSRTTPFQRPVRLIEENTNSFNQSPYALRDYQQDDRPWYETDEYD